RVRLLPDHVRVRRRALERTAGTADPERRQARRAGRRHRARRRRPRARAAARVPHRPRGPVALAGDRRGRMDGRARAAGLGALGGAVLARVVLPSPAGRAQRLAAAALVRGTVEPQRLPWILPAACAWAGMAALAGLWLWNPYGAWPEWYTFVWLPALVGVLVPAPRPWAVLGIATVAGTAAALVTWGAAVEGRLLLAERDALGLGAAADPRAASLLERLGATPPATQPRTAGELYAWWLASPLAADSYPASLAVWHR